MMILITMMIVMITSFTLVPQITFLCYFVSSRNAPSSLPKQALPKPQERLSIRLHQYLVDVLGAIVGLCSSLGSVEC